jgi:hypothetical protein
MAPSLGWLTVFAPVEIPGPNVGGLAPLSRPATVWQSPLVIVHVNHRVGGVAEQVQMTCSKRYRRLTLGRDRLGVGARGRIS